MITETKEKVFNSVKSKYPNATNTIMNQFLKFLAKRLNMTITETLEVCVENKALFVIFYENRIVEMNKLKYFFSVLREEFIISIVKIKSIKPFYGRNTENRI